MPLLKLLPILRAHFDRLEDRLACFRKHECQVESWFKGELLLLFDRVRSEGLIHDFDREVKTQAGKIDFQIEGRGDNRAAIELKHWLIGKQCDARYNAQFYFGDKSSVGICKDVQKLHELDTSGNRYMLIFQTANPEPDDWHAGIAKFNKKLAPLSVEGLTEPDDFPPSYFLGILRVG